MNAAKIWIDPAIALIGEWFCVDRLRFAKNGRTCARLNR